jgi:hypothetical protein
MAIACGLCSKKSQLAESNFPMDVAVTLMSMNMALGRGLMIFALRLRDLSLSKTGNFRGHPIVPHFVCLNR